MAMLRRLRRALGDDQFAERFKRRRVLRTVADRAAQWLSAVPPARLQEMAENRTPVAPLIEKRIRREVPPERLKALQKGLRVASFARYIDCATLLDELAKRIPEHAAVLRSHYGWYEAQIQALVRRFLEVCNAGDSPPLEGYGGRTGPHDGRGQEPRREG